MSDPTTCIREGARLWVFASMAQGIYSNRLFRNMVFGSLGEYGQLCATLTHQCFNDGCIIREVLNARI